ncbi:MAG: hypothetical protein ACQEVA_22650 [Myxococcota bacterium]
MRLMRAVKIHLASCLIAAGTLASTHAWAQAAKTVPEGTRGAEVERRNRPQKRGPFEGSLRVGVEYDDNPLRLQEDDPRIDSSDPQFDFFDDQPDGLARYFGTLQWRDDVGSDGQASVELRHGGKLYLDTSEADALLTQAVGSYRHRAGKKLWWGVAADVKDRTERFSRFDYNRGGAQAFLASALGPWRLRASGGWRYFAFKPAPSLSSRGPQLGAGLRYFLSEHWALDADYAVSLRRFDRSIDEDNVLNTRPRRDVFHFAEAGVSYRQDIIFEASYILSINESSIDAQSLTRHRLDVSLTAPLVWRMYTTLHAELQRTMVSETSRPDALFFVDEENRNVFVASLARSFGERWELEARYSLYLEEFSDTDPGAGSVDLSYRRQTLLIAVGYTFD